MPRRLLNQRPAAVVVVVVADRFPSSILFEPKQYRG
jgi:hypothetical protein